MNMTTDSLMQEAAKRGAKIGIDTEIMADALVAQRKGKTFTVEFERVCEGSFYRCAVEAGTTVLYINTDHPFYVDLYLGASTETQAALEVTLACLGLAELESGDKDLYARERHLWSQRYRKALQVLKDMTEREDQ